MAHEHRGRSRGSTRSRRTWRASTISGCVQTIASGSSRESDRRTSYALNSYLREPDETPPGIAPEPGFVSKLYDLVETHRTIVAFEAGLRVEANFDHVESPDWFSSFNLKRNDAARRFVWKAVTAEVAVERHGGGVANYLYADGHVEPIAAEQIAEWCDAGTNFAIPPQ